MGHGAPHWLLWLEVWANTPHRRSALIDGLAVQVAIGAPELDPLSELRLALDGAARLSIAQGGAGAAR